MLQRNTFRAIAASALSVSLLTLGGCSKDDDDDNASSGGKTYQLSATYGARCAVCHGAQGQGGSQRKLQGYAGTEAQFIAAVRNGIPSAGMPASPAAVYSDADVKADYKELTK